jgi:prepilin-type processing-associated H-X9-DG protein
MADASLSPRTDLKAVLSLVFGLAAPVTFGATALPALYFGFLALRQINLSDGALRGRRAAVAGMVLGAAGLVVFVLGLLVVAVAQLRDKSDAVVCQNNLRRLGKAVRFYHEDNGSYPPGTIIVEGLPPEKRLSWQVALLPYLELEPGAPGSTQARRSTGHKGADLFQRLQLPKGWEAEENRAAVNTHLPWFVCEADPYRPGKGKPGVTHYLGLAGVGEDAARLAKDDPRAGFFGYDRRIARGDVTRGETETMMVAESLAGRAPWAAGGPATVRGVNPAERPYIGWGRAFGGLHARGAHVLFVDGHVALIDARVNPEVFEAQSTIQAPP